MEGKVHFYSDGLKLVGVLYEPEGVAGNSCPGMVLCQGRRGRKETDWFPYIARLFASLGCVVLAWDYRGVGESEGEIGRLYPEDHATDTRNAITYLQLHSKVDPHRIGLYGWAFGAGMVAYIAGVDQRVKCAISAGGWGDGERWMRSVRRRHEYLAFLDRIAEDRRSRVVTGKSEIVYLGDILGQQDPSQAEDMERITAELPEPEDHSRPPTPYSLASAERLLRFKPKDVVHRISPRAILYIVAEGDTTAPADDVVDMYQRTNEPKKLWVIPGVHHAYIYEKSNLDKIMDMATDWMRQHLPIV